MKIGGKTLLPVFTLTENFEESQMKLMYPKSDVVIIDGENLLKYLLPLSPSFSLAFSSPYFFLTIL